MSTVVTGRQTANLDDEVVVFLIGMRINRLRSPRSWLPAFRAMPRMLAELAANPELGLLERPRFWSGRVFALVQYWRSFDTSPATRGLETTSTCPHGASSTGWSATTAPWDLPRDLPGRPGRAETLYANMPPFGLGAAVGQGPIAARGQSAGHRMDPSVADVPAVEPY